ncbi:MAG: hypothetical protein K6B74_07715 [Ruminococcus sp.]|nr:hypothetical protein [Ruminococcus sp.]
MTKQKFISAAGLLMTAVCLGSCSGKGANETTANTTAAESESAETTAAQESTTAATQPPETVTETTTETTVTTTTAAATEETTTTTSVSTASETSAETETLPDDNGTSAKITTFHGNGYSADIDESIWQPEDKKKYDFSYQTRRENSLAAISMKVDENEKFDTLNVYDLGNIFEESLQSSLENSDITIIDSNTEKTEIDGHLAFKITLKQIRNGDDTKVVRAVLIGIPKDGKLYTINYCIAPDEVSEEEFGIDDFIDSIKFD